MIELDHLRKSYPEFDIDLDLTVEGGELVSFLGPSGSGKTTTLRLIAGFERPDEGRIVMNGEDVTDLRPAERHIGYVFQDYTLFPHMTVGGNIGYGLRIRQEDASVITRRVEELLELMELPGYGSRHVDTLSGGERQRVAIARALAVEPVLLMLDEPFSSIDEVLRRDLRREIVRLQKELGITVLFVTHSRQEALSISDRVAVLRQGRLVQYGDPVDLYRDPVNEFVAGFVGEIGFVDHRGSRFGLRPEQVRLELDETESGSELDPGVGEVRMRGSIRSRQFLGFSWIYEIVPDAGGLLLAFDTRRLEERTVVTAVLDDAVFDDA